MNYSMKSIKRMCGNRTFYLAQIMVLDKEIKEIDILMSKPRGPRLEVIGAPAHNHESHIVDWIERKRVKEQEKAKLLEKIEKIDRIKELPSPWDAIFWHTFVLGEPVRPLCKIYGVSKDKYYRMEYLVFAKFTY